LLTFGLGSKLPCFASTLPPTLLFGLHLTLHLLCIYLAFRKKAPFWPFLADLPGFRPKMQGWQQGKQQG
jgi:hypothetical protein